jgi:hypothetical protein
LPGRIWRKPQQSRNKAATKPQQSRNKAATPRNRRRPSRTENAEKNLKKISAWGADFWGFIEVFWGGSLGGEHQWDSQGHFFLLKKKICKLFFRNLFVPEVWF